MEGEISRNSKIQEGYIEQNQQDTEANVKTSTNNKISRSEEKVLNQMKQIKESNDKITASLNDKNRYKSHLNAFCKLQLDSKEKQQDWKNLQIEGMVFSQPEDNSMLRRPF